MGATSTDDTPTDAHQAQPALAASSSQCQNCGAPLASDQRYCVACGERRGRARFSLPGAAPAPAVATTTERPPRQPRISSGLVFISFVGTLLLAMGVGVLIGHTNNSQPVQRSSNPNINVNVAGGAGGGSGSGNTQASTNTSSGQKHAAAKAAAAPLPKKVVVKAQAAAANVLGGKNLPPATVTVGQKGSGPGYSNGKFDGNFFGSP
jgi:hypothetical protein